MKTYSAEDNAKFKEYIDREANSPALTVPAGDLTLADMAEALTMSMARSFFLTGMATKTQQTLLRTFQSITKDPVVKQLIVPFLALLDESITTGEGLLLITIALYREKKIDLDRAFINADKLVGECDASENS